MPFFTCKKTYDLQANKEYDLIRRRKRIKNTEKTIKASLKELIIVTTTSFNFILVVTT